MLCVAAWVWFCLSTEFVGGGEVTATPLHEIAITSIVWCMVYTRGVRGVTRKPVCNSG